MAPGGVTPLDNVIRPQVMGADIGHTVRVTVEPASASMLSFGRSSGLHAHRTATRSVIICQCLVFLHRLFGEPAGQFLQAVEREGERADAVAE